jgi:hypothetical protein
LPPSPYSPLSPSPLNPAAVTAAELVSSTVFPYDKMTRPAHMSFLSLASTNNSPQIDESSPPPPSGRNRIRDSLSAFLGIPPDTGEGHGVPDSFLAGKDLNAKDEKPPGKQEDSEESDPEEFGLEYDEREEQANQRRTNAMRELVHTERTYVKGLRHINRVYIQPLRAQVDSLAGGQNGEDLTAPLVKDSNNNTNSNWVNSVMNTTMIRGLTPRDVHMLFANLEEILVMHEGMLEELERRFANWDVIDPISDIIQPRMAQFRKYFLYLRNYPQAMSILDRLTKQSTSFRKFLAVSNL